MCAAYMPKPTWELGFLKSIISLRTDPEAAITLFMNATQMPGADVNENFYMDPMGHSLGYNNLQLDFAGKNAKFGFIKKLVIIRRLEKKLNNLIMKMFLKLQNLKNC